MSLILVIIICVIFLVLEGFFSGSEMAIVNADKHHLDQQSKSGSKSAQIAKKLLSSPGQFFSATLLGTNISTVTSSVVITLYIIYHWGEAYAPLAILWWPFTLIFGEIVPKSLYQHYADKLILKISPILMFWSYITFPISWVLGKFATGMLKVIRKRESAEPTLSRQELEHVLEEGTVGESDVKPDEQIMIARIFDLAEKRVENIMTPLVDVKTIHLSVSRKQAEKAMEESGFSRLPVYNKESFNIVGIVTCSDLLFRDTNLQIKDLAQPAFYVPEEMPLDELFKTLRQKNKNIAIVVDEYGAATGVITTEDLLEEVVGDILDEHDRSERNYKRIKAGHYIISGRMETEEVNAKFGIDIPNGDYETFAGFIINKMEHIPMVNESFEHNGWSIIIRKATPRAIIEIEVKKNMKLAYFDCTSGVAGDMIIASLVSAGFPMKLLHEIPKLLNLQCEFVKKEETAGLKLHVKPFESLPSRHYKDILKLVDDSKLTSNVKTIALSILERIGKAESKVHKSPLNKVHFHELGTVDAIIDIVGSAAGIDYFGADEIHSSPLPMFRGFVNTEHGRLPLPAPAVAELMKNVPLEPSPIKQEIVTPTGAGIITTVAKSFGENPIQKIEKYGSGKGEKDTPPLSNCIRFYFGEGFKVAMVETTIDDMNPEIFGYIKNLLFNAGALEVNILPIQGKKDRPAFILNCQCDWNKRNKLMDLILRETTTFGVRYYPVERKILQRKIIQKKTKHGSIRIKLGIDEKGNVIKSIPEYEDCVKLAKKQKVPLIEIYNKLKHQLNS